MGKRVYNREKIRAAMRRWTKRNRKKIRAYARAWYAANPEKGRERAAMWAKKNRAEARAKTAKISMGKACPPWANHEKITQVYKLAVKLKMEVDHIIPRKHPLVCGLHVHNNLQLLTKVENKAKGDNFTPGPMPKRKRAINLIGV